MPPRSKSSLAVFAGGAALAAVMAVSLTAPAWSGGAAIDRPVKAPPPAFAPSASTAKEETAVLAGGCFWGMQGVFEHVRGVHRVVAGYAGGDKRSADYETVSTGTTGHAESVRVMFDPRQISYGQILQVYFSVATDPTQINRQYPDEGPQYRGDIFYLDGAQKAVAERYISQLDAAKVFRSRLATRLDAFSGFYPAESYHQDYLVHHPDAPYISAYDMPKLTALKQLFPALWRPTPVTT
jgi:peptide-methionine (S)-S-oxide reductase